MEARIEVEVEHLGGTATCVIATALEPNDEAWNEAAYATMANAMNGLLAAMLKERDRIRFEEEVRELGDQEHERGQADGGPSRAAPAPARREPR